MKVHPIRRAICGAPASVIVVATPCFEFTGAPESGCIFRMVGAEPVERSEIPVVGPIHFRSAR